MNCDAELKSFADGRGFDAGSNAAPESCVKQDYIDRRLQHIRGQLLKVNHDSVRGQRHSHLFANPPHSVHAKNGIFQIIVADVFDLLAKPNGSLCGPDSIWIETKSIFAKLCRQRTVTLELVCRRKHTTLQFMRREPVLFLQSFGLCDQLIDGADFATSVFRICVPKKEI